MENSTRNIILLLCGILIAVIGFFNLPHFYGYIGLGTGIAIIILSLLGFKNKKVY